MRVPVTQCARCLQRIRARDLVAFQQVLSKRPPHAAVLGELMRAMDGYEYEAVHVRCLGEYPLLVGGLQGAAGPEHCCACGARPRKGDVLVHAFVVGDVRQKPRQGPHQRIGLHLATPRWAHARCANPQLNAAARMSPSVEHCADCRAPFFSGSRAVVGAVIGDLRSLATASGLDLQALLLHAACPTARGPLFFDE